MRNRQSLFFCIGIAALLALVAGCSNVKSDQGKVLATVNGDPVMTSDLKRAVALKRKSYPVFNITPQTLRDEINSIIDKKLLIQEAQKRSLHESQRFADTIKIFWEQTLIRDLVSVKNKEFKQNRQIADTGVRDQFKAWLAEIRASADIEFKNENLLAEEYR